MENIIDFIITEENFKTIQNVRINRTYNRQTTSRRKR